MRRHSSSNLVGESSPNPTTSNPKRRNRRRSKQPFSLGESPLDTMADQHTMAELLRAPTEGYEEAIVIPPILTKHFELKHSLINMITSDQFFRLEKDNPHDHIRWFDIITSTIKYKDVPDSAIKLMLFPFSLAGAARCWLKKVPFSLGKILFPNSSMNSFLPQKRQIFEMKFPTFNNVLMNRFMRYATVTKQTSAVTTAMTAILKQFQETLPPASVKAIKEICVTCGGAHPYYQCLAVDGNTFLEFQDNIHGYVSAAAVNYNQASMSNQTNEIKNMMASFFQMNTGFTLGSRPLPSNTIANPKGELKAITTRSVLVFDGTSVPMPPPFINPEDDERAEETLTPPDVTPPKLGRSGIVPGGKLERLDKEDVAYLNGYEPLALDNVFWFSRWMIISTRHVDKRFRFKVVIVWDGNEGDSGSDVPVVAVVTMVRRLSREGRGAAVGDDDDERVL
nr:reverse transcriptase domain-containing protein [Tanacetum cinerariifolium]